MAPQAMPYRASLRQVNGPLSPRAPGSSASGPSRTPSNVTSHWTEARIDSFCPIGVAVTPGGAGRHQEAADAVVGPGPDHHDVGNGGEPDPALGAVQNPAGVRRRCRPAGQTWSSTTGPSRPSAPSARSSRSPRRQPSGGATPASGPPNPTCGSRSWPAIPGRRRTCGCLNRRPPAPWRPGRIRRRSGPGSRSPPGACPGRPARRAARARSSGKTPWSYQLGDVRADPLVREVADPLPEGQLIRGQQGIQGQDVGGVGESELGRGCRCVNIVVAHGSILRGRTLVTGGDLLPAHEIVPR